MLFRPDELMRELIRNLEAVEKERLQLDRKFMPFGDWMTGDRGPLSARINLGLEHVGRGSTPTLTASNSAVQKVQTAAKAKIFNLIFTNSEFPPAAKTTPTTTHVSSSTFVTSFSLSSMDHWTAWTRIFVGGAVDPMVGPAPLGATGQLGTGFSKVAAALGSCGAQ